MFESGEDDNVLVVGSRDETRAARRALTRDRARRRREHEFDGRSSEEPRESEIPVGLTREHPYHRPTRARRRSAASVMFEQIYGELVEHGRSFLRRYADLRERQAGDIIFFEDDSWSLVAVILLEQIDLGHWLTVEVKPMYSAEEGDTIVRPAGKSFFPTSAVSTCKSRAVLIRADDDRIGWIDASTVELIRERARSEKYRPPVVDDLASWDPTEFCLDE
jgi:hypothetical protein